MRRWTIGCAFLLLLGCQNRDARQGGGAAQKVPRVCSGQVEIDYAWPKQIVGTLRCDDMCDERTPCSEQMNAAQDRAWCGCPGEPEPTMCHLAKRRSDGDPNVEWFTECKGECPLATEVCWPTEEDLEPPPGVTRRVLKSCQCDIKNDD